MKLSLQRLLDKGVTWNNLADVWEDNNGVCYSLKDKNALDQIECEEVPGCIGEYLAAKRYQMSKKLILYVSYNASINGKNISGCCRIGVTSMQWLFTITAHHPIIKSLEELGYSRINIISVLRSYLD